MAKKSKKSATSKIKKKAVKSLKVKKVAKKVVVKAKKKKVSWLQKGYSLITPYLVVDQAKQAIDFYKKIFGAKEAGRMEQPDGKICHAELKIGDCKFMLSDAFPEMDAKSPKAYNGCAMSLHLYVKDVDAIVNGAVKAGAKLIHPLEDKLYGDRSATIEDPSGHQWTVSTHIEDVTHSQMKKRMEKFK